METRFQYILLKLISVVFVASCVSLKAFAQDVVDKPISGSADSIDNEIFEIGVNTGIINIQEFGSEYATGGVISFKATEDFFLQFNYLTADVELSSYEKVYGQYFDGDDRTFTHYDLLVGYNLFQGEFFYGMGEANISSLYVVGGVGNTEFGDEASFTYTLGVGYKIEFARSIVVRLDYRDFIYTSNLIDENSTTHNGLLSVGVGYLF